MNAYLVEIGRYTRKGAFDLLTQQVIVSDDPDGSKVRDKFSREYSLFVVKVSDIPVVEFAVPETKAPIPVETTPDVISRPQYNGWQSNQTFVLREAEKDEYKAIEQAQRIIDSRFHDLRVAVEARIKKEIPFVQEATATLFEHGNVHTTLKLRGENWLKIAVEEEEA